MIGMTVLYAIGATLFGSGLVILISNIIDDVKNGDYLSMAIGVLAVMTAAALMLAGKGI